MKLLQIMCMCFLLVPFWNSNGYADPSGFQGVVLERRMDGGLGAPVADARIVFESEDGKLRQEISSGRDGRYRIELPKGRYKVTAQHDKYVKYTTGRGFFVVNGTGFQTGNVFLRRPGELQSLALRDLPPAVTISITPARVKIGEEFSVTLMALDDSGLSSIWWFGEMTDEPELDRAHMHDCDDKQFVTQTWKVKSQKKGAFILGANARDNAYGKKLGEPHQASEGTGIPCAMVTVVDENKVP